MALLDIRQIKSAEHKVWPLDLSFGNDNENEIFFLLYSPSSNIEAWDHHQDKQCKMKRRMQGLSKKGD